MSPSFNLLKAHATSARLERTAASGFSHPASRNRGVPAVMTRPWLYSPQKWEQDQTMLLDQIALAERYAQAMRLKLRQSAELLWLGACGGASTE